MPKIFISYSRANKLFVTQLVRELGELGFDVLLDEKHLHGGRSTKGEIREKIEQADYFVPVMTQNSKVSSWVRPIEVEFALQLQRDGHQLQILPVVLKDQTVFRELSELNYVDFSKGRVSLAKLALTLANPEYDEIYNLRRELDKKSFNDRSLLSVLRRVATRARPSGTRLSWSSLSARKFMTEIEKVVKGRNFAEFVYWWLIVYGVLRFKDIDTWWDEETYPDSVDYAEIAPRGVRIMNDLSTEKIGRQARKTHIRSRSSRASDY